MGGKKPLRRPLWPPTRATASNYPLGLDGAGGAAKPLLRAPKKPAPLHGRLPAFSGAVDAFERARKCFLEWRYFFSIILSEFLKNRVALHKQASPAELACLLFRRKSCFLCRARSRGTGFIAFIKIIAAGDAPLGRRQGGVFRVPPPYLWTPPTPQRERGCSPLSDPKAVGLHTKNPSRSAKGFFVFRQF